MTAKKPSRKSWWRRWREARSERIDALRKIADELDAFRGELFDIAKGQRNDMDHLTTSMIECLHAFSSDLTKTFDIRLFEHRFLEAMDRGAKHAAEVIAKALRGTKAERRRK